MRVSIGQSETRGTITAPSSKSYTIRALMCAALAHGRSDLVHPLAADDTLAAREVLLQIGADIKVVGDRWQVRGGNLHAPKSELNCRESAATLRFMTAIAAALKGECHLTARPSLVRRPIEPLINALWQLGIECRQDTTNGVVTVVGGNFGGGTASLPGNVSSQYVTALLLAGPLARRGLVVRLTTPLESKPYVEMTIECLKRFGIVVSPSDDYLSYSVASQEYATAEYVVEGDWSSVSYFLALAALTGHIRIENLNPQSLQGDRVLLEFLRKMGAEVEVDSNSVGVSKARLTALRADLTDCIDLLPTIASLAAMADGTSELVGISRARLKESNRVSAVKQELERAGVEVSEETNKISIVGTMPKSSVFDSHGDHRIAMAMSLLGAAAGGAVIEGAECVAKTYPEYWSTFASVGGKVNANVQ